MTCKSQVQSIGLFRHLLDLPAQRPAGNVTPTEAQADLASYSCESHRFQMSGRPPEAVLRDCMRQMLSMSARVRCRQGERC